MAVLKDVTVLFSNVTNKDDYNDKYQIVVQLTEEQAADAEAAGLTLKTREYDGESQYQAAFRTQYKPRIIGLDGKTDIDLGGSEIGRHSVVSVQYKFREWTHGKKSGTSQDLVMVQVKDMKEPNSSEFDDESTDIEDTEEQF